MWAHLHLGRLSVAKSDNPARLLPVLAGAPQVNHEGGYFSGGLSVYSSVQRLFTKVEVGRSSCGLSTAADYLQLTTCIVCELISCGNAAAATASWDKFSITL